MYPGDIYMDDLSLIVDTVNPGAVRCGCLPESTDNPPLPSFQGYVIEDFLWSEWISL